jgi:ribosomal protein S21
MVFVKKKQGESDENLIRRFQKKALNAGIVKIARENQFYKPKSQKKQEKKKRIELYRLQEKRKNKR